MELFSKAEKNYRGKRFQSAYECYLRCLEDGKTDKKTTLVCCRRIIRLGELLNLRRDGETEELLARSFFHLGRHDCAIRHAEEAVANKKSRIMYEILWESLFQGGNLSRAREVAEDYLTYCKKKHLCDPGLGFIEKLEARGFGEERLSVIALELDIVRGDRKAAIGKLEELERSRGKNVGELGPSRNGIYLCKAYWERESVVRKIFLKCWREELGAGAVLAADIVERRRILHFILVDFLLEGDGFARTLEAYALAFEKKDLLRSINEYEKKECSSRDDKVGDIGNDGELARERGGREDGEGSILGEILSYKFFSDEPRDDRVGICLDGLSDDFVVRNAENLLIGLMEMNLYESSLKLIGRIRGRVRKESVEYQISMAYMEVVLLSKLGRYHKAMDLIHDSLNLLPVKKEERNTFLKEQEFLMKKIRLSKEEI